jgi:AcrR family transcriptional regulator
MTDLQKTSKYQDIAKTAHHLFWKFGIKRVTVEEICEEAGVSKMTFYRYFSNKTEVAKEVIDNLFKESLISYRALMAEDIPFAEKVKKQILLKFEGTREISSELIKDIYGGQIPELKEYWENRSNDILQEVLSNFREAQEKGWINKHVNVDFIPFYSEKIFEIVSDERAIGLYDNVQGLIMELVNLFFYGLLPHDSERNE